MDPVCALGNVEDGAGYIADGTPVTGMVGKDDGVVDVIAGIVIEGVGTLALLGDIDVWGSEDTVDDTGDGERDATDNVLAEAERGESGEEDEEKAATDDNEEGGQ